MKANGNATLASPFAPQIESMLGIRASLGWPCRTLLSSLHGFDRFVCRNHPEAGVLTQDLAQEWCAEVPSGIPSRDRMHVMRNFGKHLVSTGADAFVFPAGWIPRQAASLPHAFTGDELRRFFAAADSVPPEPRSPMRELVIPVIFRLMYACGLRPQEARLPRHGDVDFESRTILVAEAKGNRDRLLPIRDDLAILCQKYDGIAEARQPGRAYFFQSPRGGEYSNDWLDKQFHRVRGLAGGIAQGSVPYDLRHNFATKTMALWTRENRDLNKWLPYLSAYMGHSSFAATSYCIHLLPEHLSAADPTDISWIIPEADS